MDVWLLIKDKTQPLDRRVYQCRRCPRYGRKNRIVSHVMRDHVPADRVPFYCTLCNFRCQDAATLKSHIQRYKRHQREEAMAGGKHYLTWLQKAEYPIFVGGSDIIRLSREESETLLRTIDDSANDAWFDQEENPNNTAGPALPSWLTEETFPASMITGERHVQASPSVASMQVVSQRPPTGTFMPITTTMTLPTQLIYQPTRMVAPVTLTSDRVNHHRGRVPAACAPSTVQSTVVFERTTGLSQSMSTAQPVDQLTLGRLGPQEDYLDKSSFCTIDSAFAVATPVVRRTPEAFGPVARTSLPLPESAFAPSGPARALSRASLGSASAATHSPMQPDGYVSPYSPTMPSYFPSLDLMASETEVLFSSESLSSSAPSVTMPSALQSTLHTSSERRLFLPELPLPQASILKPALKMTPEKSSTLSTPLLDEHVNVLPNVSDICDPLFSGTVVDRPGSRFVQQGTQTDLPSREEDLLKKMLGTMEEHLRAAVRTERKVLSVLEEVRRIERKLDVKARAREQSSGRSTGSKRRRSNDGENRHTLNSVVRKVKRAEPTQSARLQQ
ncbi:hypothetical protein DPMN_126461 [Dreissena polymorpha]|uniref:C2H2-type domain-containing protein n=1 Tax=Dreissena polymorpha TaxID=45954 RepID=A0A9D4H069_DREPO|nr:hypothetical protein DPMN_126461 [Dreissena polymorpha]